MSLVTTNQTPSAIAGQLTDFRKYLEGLNYRVIEYPGTETGIRATHRGNIGGKSGVIAVEIYEDSKNPGNLLSFYVHPNGNPEKKKSPEEAILAFETTAGIMEVSTVEKDWDATHLT